MKSYYNTLEMRKVGCCAEQENNKRGSSSSMSLCGSVGNIEEERAGGLMGYRDW